MTSGPHPDEIKPPLPVLGVVVVSYNAAEIILDCLESLRAAPGVDLRVVVVDNASGDDTVALIRAWAGGGHSYAAPSDMPFDLTACTKPVAISARPDTPGAITLIESPTNTGFAGGVNQGLAALQLCAGVDRFWVLNPDSAVPPDTPARFATYPEPEGGFALMGGRINFLERPDRIQSDGGRINWITGMTRNLGAGQSAQATPPAEAASMEFIGGASMVASRRFLESVGPMREEYFLYYEEVDWALRRGDLPLIYCPGATIYHRAGTAIGSPTDTKMASPFSLYFKLRARMMFLRRHAPRSVIAGYGFGLAKALQALLKGYPAQARAILHALHGRPPPLAARGILSPEADRMLFGPRRD